MDKQAKNTFGEMSSFLRSLGFVPMRRGSNIVFSYPGAGPVILLPAYKSGQVVKPIHRMMVKKQLTDAGLLRPGPIMIPKQPKALPKLKAKSKSRKKIEI